MKVLLSHPRLALRADPVHYYEYLGDDVVEGEASGFADPNKPLWLNLGYWTDASALTYEEAAIAMARLLGEAAQLGPNDAQLDVGFGFAEQDFFWLKEFGVPHITGLNITPMQVAHAQARAKQRQLSERLDLRVGSATAMPFSPNSFTKVTALECAHHFPTREQFFHEAFRVLQPGGRLSLTDGVPLPGERATMRTKLVLRHWASPIENYYDRDVYRAKLAAAGFTNIQIRRIGDQVFPGTLAYANLRKAGKSMAEARVKLTPENIAQGLKAWAPMGLNDYLLVSADKPAS
jgi:microcystin synthetase protein McyJ